MTRCCAPHHPLRYTFLTYKTSSPRHPTSQVLFAERPDVSHALTDFYTYINCPFDLNGEKSWWHGAVWHYDFCLGK